MKYYISDYGNTRMKNFLVRNDDVKEDSQGIYTLDPIDFEDFQQQFVILQYFKTINDFVETFEIEEMISFKKYSYVVRVVEDDEENVYSLVYERENGAKTVTINDVVEIIEGDILCKVFYL